MSSATHNLPFVRFTRQVRTEPQALLATDVAALNALEALKVAPWAEQNGKDVTFPARNALQDGFNPLWDAFKHVGNYESGYQQAYAGMVAYRFAVPADALTAPADVVSISVPLHVDRWLVDGMRLAVYVSDSNTPTIDWGTLRSGDVHLDAQLPMLYTVPDGNRIVIEKSSVLTLLLPAATAAKKYLYVIVSLENYATTRGFWIEGAALIVSGDAITTFSTAVSPDSVSVFSNQFFTRPHIDQAGLERIVQNGNANYNAMAVPTEADSDLLWATSYVRSSLRENIGSIVTVTKSGITALMRVTDGLGNFYFSDGFDAELADRVVCNKEKGVVIYRHGPGYGAYTSDLFTTFKPLVEFPLSLFTLAGVLYKSTESGCDSTIDDGTTWTPSAGVPGGYYSKFDDNNLAAALSGEYVKISTTGIGGFVESSGSAQRDWANVIHFGSASKICAVTSTGDAYITQNGGSSWALSNAFDGTASYTGEPGGYGLISPANDVIIYMHHADLYAWLNVTTDGGANWTTTKTTYPDGNSVVDLGEGSWALIGSGGKLLITKNNGATFQETPLPFSFHNGAIGSAAIGQCFAIGRTNDGSTQKAYISEDTSNTVPQIQINQSLLLFAGGITDTQLKSKLVFDVAVPSIPEWLIVDLRVYASAGVLDVAIASDAAYWDSAVQWYAGQDVGRFKHLASVRASDGMDRIPIDTSQLGLGYYNIIISAHIANITAKPDPFIDGTWYGMEWAPKMVMI